jgi:ribosome biogenesis SPOUT family RNA methylase Rps3
MPKIKYIVEHLEPKLSKWCLIEYENISHLVGKNNLIFTNIKKSPDQKKLKKLGKVFKQSVSELSFNKICVLDPESSVLLQPKDKSKFNYFVFGGILGDYPPKKRTKKELTKFLPSAKTRNIGKKQMSTDNAIYTTKQIIEKKIPFSKMEFKYKISIPISKFASVELPYQYNLVKGKPFMSPKIPKLLKRKRGF